jgi:uncharacterized protein
MIVDCHCDAVKGDLLTEPWDTNAAIEPYLKRTRTAGIDKTAIFSPLYSNYEQANTNTAQIAARYPGRFLCFAFVHPKRDRTSSIEGENLLFNCAIAPEK